MNSRSYYHIFQKNKAGRGSDKWSQGRNFFFLRRVFAKMFVFFFLVQFLSFFHKKPEITGDVQLVVGLCCHFQLQITYFHEKPRVIMLVHCGWWDPTLCPSRSMRTPLGCAQNGATDDASTWLKNDTFGVCFLTVRKWMFPRIMVFPCNPKSSVFNRVFHYKPSFLGAHPYIRKHPDGGKRCWYGWCFVLILLRSVGCSDAPQRVSSCHVSNVTFNSRQWRRRRCNWRDWGEWTMFFWHLDIDFKFICLGKSFDFLAIVTLWTRSLFAIDW